MTDRLSFPWGLQNLPLSHLLAGCGDHAGAEQCDDYGDRLAAGIVRGLPCVVGAAAGMAALLFTAALGLGQLILGHPESCAS